MLTKEHKNHPLCSPLNYAHLYKFKVSYGSTHQQTLHYQRWKLTHNNAY